MNARQYQNRMARLRRELRDSTDESRNARIRDEMNHLRFEVRNGTR